ncbi:hypothetical protein COOONC_14938, partial [Cooperia oncophora]
MNTKFCEIDAQLYRYYAEHAEQQSNQNATTSAPRNYDIRQRPPMRFDALLMESDPDVSDDDDDPMYEPPPNSKNLLKNEVVQSEKRMFDKWTEMATAQIKTFEAMLSMQKETLQQIRDIV